MKNDRKRIRSGNRRLVFQSVEKEKWSIVKSRPVKQRSLCILLILLLAYAFAGPATAESEASIAVFEDLKDACADAAARSDRGLLCTEDDLVISEDFTLPPGTVFTLRHFTVPEGITFTVAEQSEIHTYGLTVEGTLENHGTIIQQDLSAAWAEGRIETTARIPGHIENSGEMILTDVFGRRNINRFGGKLTMNQTADFQEKLRIAAGIDTPAPTEEIPAPPAPAPPAPEKWTASTIFALLEDILPKLMFFFVLAGLFLTVKNGIASVRAEKYGASSRQKAAVNRTADSGYDIQNEDHFQRDRRNRIAELDVWLKNGLIDRKEYNELKSRYSKEV